MPSATAAAWSCRALYVLTFGSAVYCIFDGSLFSLHPSLMAAAFLVLATEGALTALHFRNLSGSARSSHIRRHAGLQLGTVAISAAGFVVAWQAFPRRGVATPPPPCHLQVKVNQGAEHFDSLHGKVGLATTIAVALTAAGGAVSFGEWGLLGRLPRTLHASVKAAHHAAGPVTLLMALTAILLGLMYPSVYQQGRTQLWQAGTLAIGALVVYMLLQPARQAPPKQA